MEALRCTGARLQPNFPEALNSKAVVYCCLGAGKAFSSLARCILHPLGLGKGRFLDCKGLLHPVDVCNEQLTAGKKKKKSRVAHLKLSGVLAVGGPFKSDGISWLQWA